MAVIEIVRRDRAGRVGQHEFGLRRNVGEVAAQPAQRAAGADANHDSVHVMLHLPPQLGGGSGGMGRRIGRVVELIDIKAPGISPAGRWA